MSIPQFSEISSFSTTEITEAIIKTENKLFDLRFKKATRQNFKSHQLKYNRRKLAQLKTLLTLQLQKTQLNK